MEVGDYISNVLCVSFIDPQTGRLRVKTKGNAAILDGVLVESSKKERENHPVGTRFRTENVKVCQKPDGRIYVRAKDQMIYPVKSE